MHEIRLLLQSGGPPDDPAVPVDELDRPDTAGAPAGEWTQGIAAAERVLRVALSLTRTAATNGENTPAVADALFEISVSVIHLAQLKRDVQTRLRSRRRDRRRPPSPTMRSARC